VCGVVELSSNRSLSREQETVAKCQHARRSEMHARSEERQETTVGQFRL
jgi:hypothetical protein